MSRCRGLRTRAIDYRLEPVLGERDNFPSLGVPKRLALKQPLNSGLGLLAERVLTGHQRNGVAHACSLGGEGIVSKRLGSIYRSGRSANWIKVKNPAAPAVTREAEEDWRSGRPA